MVSSNIIARDTEGASDHSIYQPHQRAAATESACIRGQQLQRRSLASSLDQTLPSASNPEASWSEGRTLGKRQRDGGGETDSDGGPGRGANGHGDGGGGGGGGTKIEPQDPWQQLQQQQQAVHEAAAAAYALQHVGMGSGVPTDLSVVQEGMDRAMLEHHQQQQQQQLQQLLQHHQQQQQQQQHVAAGPNGELPLLPLVMPGSNAADSAQQQQQQQHGPAMTPAAAAEAAVAEATAAASQAAAASHDAMSLSMGMHWLAAQAAAQASDADAARRGMRVSGSGSGSRPGGARKSDGVPEGMSAAVDAAAAAAMAGGADADTAAAMSASIAALMSDPAAAAAAAAAMSDPNNPANMQALAQLAQLQGLGQLPPGTSTEALNSSFSALVAAAVGMAALEGGNPGGLPPGMMGMPDPALITAAQAAGMAMTQPVDMNSQAAIQQGKGRGRPRKSGTSDVAGVPASGPPSGNWMRRFHEQAYLADKASLDASKISSGTMTVHVQWANMPEDLQDKLSMAPAPIEVPGTATVSFLKRAIGRTLGGHLYPTILRNPATREVLSDWPEDRTLSSLGITHSSYIAMETECPPIPNFGMTPANSIQRLNQGLGTPSGFSLPGSGSRVGTKERFTLTEMYSLVEGMEQHGLKWAKIHKEFKDLENKTQGDLKDKWRNWQRNCANGWSTARVYMPDELKQRIEKMVNDYNMQVANSGSVEGGLGGGGGGRMLQEASDTDPTGMNAAVAAMAAGLHMHGLDPSQMPGMDAATAAAIAAHHQQHHQQAQQQQQQHLQHHHAMHHYDAAAMAAALAGMDQRGTDPAAQQAAMEAAAAAAASSAAAGEALPAGGEHMLADATAMHHQQQQHHHQQQQEMVAYHYDPSQQM